MNVIETIKCKQHGYVVPRKGICPDCISTTVKNKPFSLTSVVILGTCIVVFLAGVISALLGH